MKRQDKTNFWDWAFRALAAAIVIAICIIAHERDIQTPPAVVDKAFSEMYGGATILGIGLALVEALAVTVVEGDVTYGGQQSWIMGVGWNLGMVIVFHS